MTDIAARAWRHWVMAICRAWCRRMHPPPLFARGPDGAPMWECPTCGGQWPRTIVIVRDGRVHPIVR